MEKSFYDSSPGQSVGQLHTILMMAELLPLYRLLFLLLRGLGATAALTTPPPATIASAPAIAGATAASITPAATPMLLHYAWGTAPTL